MSAIMMGIGPERLEKTEENKVYWVMINTLLNGISVEHYNWLEESELWAKCPDYFPGLSWQEFLVVARKYDFWNELEKNMINS